jgi:antitoxin HicB
LLELTPDDNDTFLVICPALPEVTTFGDNEADARHHGTLAVEEAIAARMAKWIDLPAPVRTVPPGRPYVKLPTSDSP